MTKPPSSASSTTSSWRNRLRETKEELFNLRFQNGHRPARQLARGSTVLRKDMARCRTLLREREIELAEGSELR